MDDTFDVLGKVFARVSSLDEELVVAEVHEWLDAGDGRWLAGVEATVEEDTIVLNGLGRPERMCVSEACVICAGLGFLAALEELRPGDLRFREDEKRRLRAALARRLGVTANGVCTGVAKSTGTACKAAVIPGSVSTVCGRHGPQDLVSSLVSVLVSFPKFPVSALVFAGGQDTAKDAVICSICPRARSMEDCTSECAELGEPEADEQRSVFTHWPTWLEAPEADLLDRPGRQFCLSCASNFPRACEFVGLLQTCADGPTAQDEELPSRELWVWAPDPRLLTAEVATEARSFSRVHAVGVPAFFSSVAVPSTPGAGAAAAMKTGLGKFKAGTNTARRAELRESMEGARLESRFGEPAGLAQAPPPAQAASVHHGVRGLIAALNAGATEDQLAVALSGLVETRAASLVGRQPTAIAPPPASSSSGTDLADALTRLSLLEAKLEAKGAVSQGAGPLRFPSRPESYIFPSEADRDTFEGTHRAHALSPFRARAEDYLGALLTPKGYRQRREFLIGRERLDYSARRAMMPEETSSVGDTEFLMVGDTRIEGAAKRMGIPAQGDYDQYAQARITDLFSSLVGRSGPHVAGSAGVVYAEAETKLMITRYKFLQATEHYLTSGREPTVAWGVVWRYMCHLVGHMWLNKEIESVSFDADLVRYALTAPIGELAVRSAPGALRTVAAVSVNVDWLRDAEALHSASLGKGLGGGGGSGNGGGNGGGDGAPKRCVCCGNLVSACGGYFGPKFACTNECTIACRKCGVKHMESGARGWRCGGAKKADQLLGAADCKAAFLVSFTRFKAGETKVAKAKVDEVCA